MKKILKNRIFLCVITAITFGTIGVSAATYFASSQVTYNNTESGLNSNNVQGAIDELYNACKTPPTGGNSILDKVDIVTSGDGLYEDEYEDGRYFYKGKNVNNYVTFNNETAGWRIVSIEKDGTIKIIRVNSIGTQAWDSSNSNNWARPSTLNTYLNSTYYNELNTTAQSQIIKSTYYAGGENINDNNNLQTTINNEKTIKIENTNVALITISEYVRSNSDSNKCNTANNAYFSQCYETSWMHDKSDNDWWTMTPSGNSSNHSLHVATYGGFIYGSGALLDVRPVVTISSDIKIIGGDGSQSDPYVVN